MSKPLTQMQDYIGREMVDEFRAGHISRRVLFKRLIMICGGTSAAASLLAACGDHDGSLAIADGGVGGPDGPPARTEAGVRAALSVPADDPALITSRVSYPSTGVVDPILGYLSRPKAPGNYPGVIVIHENRGLNDHIRDVARRVAKAGFIALAPDLTSRVGSTERIDQDQARTYLANATPGDLLADLNAGVSYLAQQMGVVPADKVGVVGFCFGGGYTFRFAAQNPRVAAAVPYYGPAPQPIDMLKTTSAAILAHYAENDTNVNSTRDMVEMVLKDAGKIFEKRIHPGTSHAFNNDTGMAYNEAEAVAAWHDTIAWLTMYLRP
jgi:carboxymethylenebutenolidase